MMKNEGNSIRVLAETFGEIGNYLLPMMMNGQLKETDESDVLSRNQSVNHR